MTELKNAEGEIRQFKRRLVVAMLFVCVCFGLLVARFSWLQIVRHDLYAARAEDNRISLVPIVPIRGAMTDRHGVVLARNYSAYTLEITPSKLQRKLADVIEELTHLIDIQPKDRRRFAKSMEESRSFSPIVLRSRLSDEEVARFTAQRYRFPGVDVQARFFREYPLGDVAAHVVGYTGRISQKDEVALKERGETANYKGTDIIGKEGLEKSYEKQLHGVTGYEEIEISATGRPVRSLSRVSAIPGQDLVLSLDIELQKVVQAAFGQRRGAFVAIEPATGAILAYVSQPGYDLNLFAEGIDQTNWDALVNSPDHPLINRPMSATYPPGSTYKPFMALAALTLGKRTPTETIVDPGYYVLGNHRFRGAGSAAHGIVDMRKAIVVSSDVYFYMLARDMGVDDIHDFMKPFGFGQKTGIDLAYERMGVLPSTRWKQQNFTNPEQRSWLLGDTISLGIGQGYNAFTPLQMAHATAILANNGVVMTPHLVMRSQAVSSSLPLVEVAPKPTYRIPLQQTHMDFVKQAMVDVTKEGTAARVFAGAPYTSGGKTGTAQVFTIKQNEKYIASQVKERLRDHAWYIAFAPAENPTIAIAVIVENAGWGVTGAAPIVRSALDYYLLKRGGDSVISAEES